MMRRCYIATSTVRDDRRSLFLFNDDVLRIGRSGLAAFMRGEPNTLGVRVRPSPEHYWCDTDFTAATAKIDSDLSDAIDHLKKGTFQRIIFPAQGLGIEALRRAPLIFAHLTYRLIDMERDFGVEQLHMGLVFETTHDGVAVPLQRTLTIPFEAAASTVA